MWVSYPFSYSFSFLLRIKQVLLLKHLFIKSWMSVIVKV